MIDGYHEFGVVCDPRTFLGDIKALRSYGRDLFMNENEFTGMHKGVNPRAGRNMLEHLDCSVVEDNPAIRAYLSRFLGDGYEIMDRKVVVGVPDIPDWVRERIEGKRVNNLGAYVRPEFRDATYFHGIDFHQDLIDWPGQEADFVTLYIYLTDVGPDDAPLKIIPGSHFDGASVFPHDTMGRPQKMLLGKAGSAFLWHALMLHGTGSVVGSEPRFSLRYLFRKGELPIDRVNRTIAGPLSLDRTRRDLMESGEAA